MRSRMNSFDKTNERVSMFRYGFTLVELLVVIAIIGILMGIAVPAIFGVIETANSNKQKLELGAIEQAIERYQQQYGDYPPDFSDWTVVERHYRKIFPRIAPAQLNLLEGLLSVDNGGTSVYAAEKMDRAEVIYWTLGGYSSNPIFPFTGDGGPLEEIGDTGQFQINTDRDNAFFEFDTARLDLVIQDKDAPISPTNYYASSDSDLFARYAAHSDGAPFVYFDARTYDSLGFYPSINSDSRRGIMFNLFYGGDFGSARPYVGAGNLVDGYQFL